MTQNLKKAKANQLILPKALSKIQFGSSKIYFFIYPVNKTYILKKRNGRLRKQG